jgi:hypothetical protein
MAVTDTDADTTITPLSELRGGPRELREQIFYEQKPGRDRKFSCDLHLLGLLNEALGPGMRVGDLDERALRDILDRAEDDLYDRGWRLAGDDSDPPLARVDEHFAPRQAAYKAMLAEQARQREARARQAAEQRLNEQRGWIGFQREAIEQAQARLEAMEQELEADAARLGVPAWPPALEPAEPASLSTNDDGGDHDASHA